MTVCIHARCDLRHQAAASTKAERAPCQTPTQHTLNVFSQVCAPSEGARIPPTCKEGDFVLETKATGAHPAVILPSNTEESGMGWCECEQKEGGGSGGGGGSSVGYHLCLLAHINRPSASIDVAPSKLPSC